MDWTCPKCKIHVPNVVYPVHCRCGGFFTDPATDTSISSLKPNQLVFHTPIWEREERVAACEVCSRFSQTDYKMCKDIEMGCHNAWDQAIRTTCGSCPHNQWTKIKIDWITVDDLTTTALEVADKLPKKIGRIIGIPRSGMIPAATIATKLHLPLWTIYKRQLQPAGGGYRMEWGNHRRNEGIDVLVDDTLHNGHTIYRLREDIPRLRHACYAVMYSLSPEKCDIVGHYLPSPHLLEWNLMNSAYVTHIATDMDGVLCHNPPEPIPHDAPPEVHREVSRNALPLHLSRMIPLRAIITARPESERDVTEQWLEQHGVKYQRLLMWQGDYQDRDFHKVIRWKAEMFANTKPDIYVESEPPIAEELRKYHIRVLCPAQGYLA